MASDTAQNSPFELLERPTPRPMIVADNAHVNYRVYASGKRVGPRERLFSVAALRGGRELKTVPALRGVTFTASEGETIGVVGHNGSGKSTLFRAMSGLVPTSEGTIWARDRPVLLGVNAALVPSLSGENNIKLGLLAMGFTAEEAAAQVDPIADFAELNEFIHHPMRTYSAGMGARLRFAIASAKAHSILLVDEALAVGDRRFRLKSEKRIAELRESAGLVMIVSHSVGSLRDTCDRVLWVHKGELRADGPTNDVIADYVKWTKDPKSVAVGAASKPAMKPAAETEKPQSAAIGPASDTAAPAAPAAAKAAEADAGLSIFDELLRGLEPESPREAAEETKRSLARAESDARAATRRERYQREADRRVRKRVIAAIITGAAILAAIGIGAAFALATSGAAAAPQSVSSPRPTTSSTPTAAAQPVIVAFSTAKAPVVCTSEEASALATFSWEVTDATNVQVALTSTAIDPSAPPATMPPKAKDATLPFPCASEAESYTLTALGEDGTRVSKAVTVTRQIDPTAPPQDAPESTSPQPSNPVQQQPPASTTPTTPPAEPSTAPSPAPLPPLPTALPTIPAPEPSDPPPPVEEPPPAEESGGTTDATS
ncbi:ABC transporter ATP-binding protein [Microbacterium sp. NPDC089321]|uniref:ABC transporter ATP-binding protein n=1 Tax=Microbacterium sp. NPDC089321 TaxID=3155183 RepID=UPI0034198832